MANDRMKCRRVGTSLVWSFDGYPDLAVDTAKLDADIRELGMYQGIKKKVSDGAAIAYRRPDGTFRQPTMAEKRTNMQEIAARLLSGTWNAVVASVDSGVGLLAALQRVGGVDPKYANFVGMTQEQFREWADARAEKIAADRGTAFERKDVYKILRAVPAVAAQIAAMQAPADVTVDDMLDD